MFINRSIFVPRAQMEIRAPSPDQVHGLEGLVCGQVQKVPVPTGSPSALRYSLHNLRVGKAVSARRPLNHRLGGRGRETALVDSSALG